jgi:hypothetical protein
MAYEYKLVRTSREEDLEETLNKLGKDGWEVVTFREHTANGFNVLLKKGKE